MEYPAPNIPTYNTTMPIFLDMVHNAAGIPGSGDYPVHFTYTRDIGRYTAALLSLSNWDKRYLIAGDTKTLKEAVALGEKVKGTKFDVSFDSIEKLERGEYTELPGYAAAFAYLGAADVGKEMLGHMMVFFSLMFARGYASFKGAKWLNEMFPEIKPLGLEEALVMSFGEGKKE